MRLEEKELGIDATNWMKDKLTETIKGDEELTIRTELKGGVGKYGRLLGWLYIFEELREIRRSFGSLVES